MDNTLFVTQNTEINAEALVEEAETHLNNLRDALVKAAIFMAMIGYELKWFKESGRYRFLNNKYKTFEEFALEEFRLARATAYNYIKVFDECTICTLGEDGKTPCIEMKNEYKDYSFSQLLEILRLRDDEKESGLQMINPSMSVREINRTLKELRNTSNSINAEKTTDASVTKEKKDAEGNEVNDVVPVNSKVRNVIAVSGCSWEDIISSKTQKAVNKILEAETSIDDLVIEIVISHRNIA